MRDFGKRIQRIEQASGTTRPVYASALKWPERPKFPVEIDSEDRERTIAFSQIIQQWRDQVLYPYLDTRAEEEGIDTVMAFETPTDPELMKKWRRMLRDHGDWSDVTYEVALSEAKHWAEANGFEFRTIDEQST